MHNYKALRGWQNADELTFQVYQITRDFPSEERYGLLLTGYLWWLIFLPSEVNYG